MLTFKLVLTADEKIDELWEFDLLMVMVRVDCYVLVKSVGRIG